MGGPARPGPREVIECVEDSSTRPAATRLADPLAYNRASPEPAEARELRGEAMR